MKKNHENSGDLQLAATRSRAYERPVLREFGAVKSLTQSGTGFMAENAMMMGAMRSPMN